MEFLYDDEVTAVITGFQKELAATVELHFDQETEALLAAHAKAAELRKELVPAVVVLPEGAAAERPDVAATLEQHGGGCECLDFVQLCISDCHGRAPAAAPPRRRQVLCPPATPSSAASSARRPPLRTWRRTTTRRR
jgi:hypothetical protein